VLSEPYSLGRSSHAQPRLLVFFGMSDSITAYCSSVRSCLLMPLF
jgi:hypothetical protein